MSEQPDKQQPPIRQQSLPLSWAGAADGSRADIPPPGAEEAAGAGPPPEPDAPAPEQPPPQVAAHGQPPDVAHETVGEADRTAEESTPEPPAGRLGPDAPPPAAVCVTALGEVETSLGQALLEGRGARNLSIMQVSQKTRIPRDFITNIEADAVEQLPVAVYTRSYITQLCREYGMDSAEILARYQRVLEPADPALESVPRGAAQGQSAGVPLRYRPPIPCEVHRGNMLRHVARYAVLGALLLLVTLVLAAFGIQHYKNLRARRGTPNDPLPIEPPAIDVEEFIIPQELPLVELPVPES